MADTNQTPTDRVRIFDRSGTAIAEFRASVDRSLVLGDEGRAQFTYPSRKTQVVNARTLNFGNWLLVENSHLPPWVGVIDTPRDWSTRNATVYAYSPERVLGWRVGPLEETLNGSAGDIFSYLINRANGAEQTILRSGNIWRGGPQRQETINPTPLSDTLKQLWERSGEDYSWTPSFDNDGRLLVYGNWLPFLGAEIDALLQEGKGGGNVEAVGKILVEDGPIVNSVLAYGEGSTWASKPNSVIQDAHSVGVYGLREGSKDFSGVTIATTLYDNGLNYVNQYRAPARSFQINALHVGDTFKYIGLGNILKIRFENIGFLSATGGYGFESRVRIVGMRYNPSSQNKIQLVVREVV